MENVTCKLVPRRYQVMLGGREACSLPLVMDAKRIGKRGVHLGGGCYWWNSMDGGPLRT